MTAGIEGSTEAVDLNPQDIDAGYAPLPHPEVLSYPFDNQLLRVNCGDPGPSKEHPTCCTA